MDLIKTQLIESVFAGGGEMGARMRALDWSATALGPLEQWPQSLRASVRVMLGSEFPMLVCWGSGYPMLYNDAYGPLIGKKPPAALGRSIREVIPETWDFLGPRFDKVMEDGQEASPNFFQRRSAWASGRCASKIQKSAHEEILWFSRRSTRGGGRFLLWNCGPELNHDSSPIAERLV